MIRISKIVKDFSVIIFTNFLKGKFSIPTKEDLGLSEKQYSKIEKFLELTLFFISCTMEISNDILKCNGIQATEIIISILEDFEDDNDDLLFMFSNIYEAVVYLISLCCIIYFNFHTSIDDKEMEIKIDKLSLFVSEKLGVDFELAKGNILTLENSLVFVLNNPGGKVN